MDSGTGVLMWARMYASARSTASCREIEATCLLAKLRTVPSMGVTLPLDRAYENCAVL